MAAPYIDPARIRARAWSGSYDRGAAYLGDGAVRSHTWDPETRTLSAQVRGSGTQLYRCTIQLDIDGSTAVIRLASCTCPMQEDCKHTVAAMLASNAEHNARERTERPQGPTRRTDTRTVAPWRTLVPTAGSTHAAVDLALGVELRQRSASSAARWATTRMETASPRGLARRQDPLTLGLRPLMRSSSTGAWIKGDVSWDALRRPGGAFTPAQARWFAELYGISRDLRTLGFSSDSAEWLTLDSIESALLWPHLAAASALGIPFVPTTRSQSVSMGVTAEISIDVAATQDAGLHLTARVEVDGSGIDSTQVRAIGRTGLYAFAITHPRVDIVFAPVSLSEPIVALLGAGSSVTVPVADVAEFLRDAYPVLARRAHIRPAGGVQLPEPEPPHLLLTVAFRPADGIDYHLAWEYAGAGRFPYARTSDADRDCVFEDTVRAAIETVWADAAPLPFAPRATLHDVDAAEFASRIVPTLEQVEHVRVTTTGRRRAYHELTGAPEIRVSTVESTDPDWFDLGVLVTIEGRRIPFTPLFTALALRKKKLLLSDGRYFSLAHPALDRLRDLIEEAAELAEWETGARISRYQSALWEDFEDVADEAVPAVSWRATADGLRDVTRVDPTPVPHGLHARLRQYQQQGFEWLAFLWSHRLGGILADDMGLGKTLQMLALIQHAHESGEQRAFLVIAPTSVLPTWRAEAARFAPGLRVTVLDATHATRATAVRDEAASADIVVTSYAVLRLDEAEFAPVEWAAVVLDEAQFVKNPKTRLHRAVAALRADVTYALTGTPLENSLMDLWALLSLTAPGLFASARRFREEYVNPIEKGKVPDNQEGGGFREARLERLRRRIRPLLLRRTKELVAPDLPPKQEQRLEIELGPAHRAIYDIVLQRERQKVLGLLEDLDRNRFIVFRSLTLLRMLSLAPGLVDAADAHIPSSRLDVLIEHLTELIAEGHRALVFSQFTSYLSLVSQRLERASIAHTQLDGSTRRRADVIHAFRSGENPVFLISLKAGGFGLTLTEADYVFLLDPWWNPAAEAQAVDRTHRIGQHRPVNVYRMVAVGTIEEKVMALQDRKARLFQSVMDHEEGFGAALTAQDIRGLFE